MTYINKLPAITFLVLTLSLNIACGYAKAPKMTPDRIGQLLEEHTGDLQSSDNMWQFKVQNVNMALVFDTTFDRMRIIAPIMKVDDITDEQKDNMMASNFHLALDARYATGNGLLYAAFIHPLSSLNEKELVSALRQVSTLALTFGTTYTSGELTFGQPEQVEPEDEEKDKKI